ncbi:MAG: ABC transporter ATP-binding protein [Polyangiaceae bacterium]|nr:ABC transporter ATP-binding protein [Polyangiaceae bacterium]MCW5788919.1 ABC transporter ATP-binding protein [Polyangiaceae bacterium]
MSVRVESITKRFGADAGRVTGVSGVSFEAPSHAITSLVGPSGSGKSTLLRLVAGLEQPDQGRVLVEGEDLTRVPVQARRLGFVFQNYALFRHMSVFDNIAFGLSVRGASRKEQAARVSELLELVQLADYAKRLPDQLSGGQRQRVALARALAPRPRVLLLDEPFGALDTQVRVELREWLHRLHEQTQVTTLLVTHDQEEALELSQHVVLLREGQVEQAGTPTELYESPRSAFVASFLGGAQILKGQVSEGQLQLPGQELSADVDHADGAVEAFVRPHDVRLVRADEPGGAPARVERLIRVGGFVKLTVRLDSGEVLQVQMSRTAQLDLGVEAGDPVRVDLGGIRVIARRGYSI